MIRLKRQQSLERITRYLAALPNIRLGIVFGSVARGSARSDSDLDIALLGDEPLSAKHRFQLVTKLSELAERPIDLVDLRTAGVPVARSAVLNGKVVYSRSDAEYPAQLSKVLLDTADFLPYRNRILKERRDAWTR